MPAPLPKGHDLSRLETGGEDSLAALRLAMVQAIAMDTIEISRFETGETIRDYVVQPDQVHHMIYLVAYDIANPSRLRQVAKACQNFGVRVEKSVFQCDLPPERFQKLWCRLIDIIQEDEDAVIAYRLCASCLREVESMGIVTRVEKPICYIL